MVPPEMIYNYGGRRGFAMWKVTKTKENHEWDNEAIDE
ncbi:hypothetical protein CARUB_v10027664mg, partial [Capsella rubella]